MNPAHYAARVGRKPQEQKEHIKRWSGKQKENRPTWKWYLLLPHSYPSKSEAFDGNNSSVGTLHDAKPSQGHLTLHDVHLACHGKPEIAFWRHLPLSVLPPTDGQGMRGMTKHS